MNKIKAQVAADIKAAAAGENVRPALLTKAQFLKYSEVSEWSLRKLGGFAAILKQLHPFTEKDHAEIRAGKSMQSYVNKLEADLGKKDLYEKQIHGDVVAAVKALGLKKVTALPKPRVSKSKPNMCVELMLSDIHYGLLSKEFDLATCRKRMTYLTQTLLEEIERSKAHYNVERVIVALIGDIVQSYTMHGLESAVGCEFGNSRQVEVAIDSLFNDVLLPLALTGIKVDVPAVTGNHDRTENKRTYNYPGVSNLTWTIYNALKLLCEAKGLKNVTFYIPQGSWQTLEIYGNNVLYEHGDNSQGNTETALESLVRKRERQLDKVIHFARFGHFHKYYCHDFGRLIGNLSVCGEESYGETLGFVTTAGQVINYYIETKTRPTCFYKSFPVFLGHIKKD